MLMNTCWFVGFSIVFLGNIAAAFSSKNRLSKCLYILMIVGIIILASSQTWNYDYESYRYYYRVAADGVLSGVEPGFLFFAQISSSIFSLTYEQFRIVVFVLMFCISGFYLWRCSERPNAVLLLYFIFFFAVNITQIRSGLAEAFVIASIYYLKEKKQGKYLVCIAVGSLFHITALYFLILLLLYFEKTRGFIEKHKKEIVISSIIMLIAFRLFGSLIPFVVNIINRFGADYRTSVNFAEYAGNHYLKYLPVPAATIVLFHLIVPDDDDREFNFYELVCYLSLYIYPFFTINRQLSRISRVFVIISLIPFTKYFIAKRKMTALFALGIIVYLGYIYYCLSAYTSCLDPLLHYSYLSWLFGSDY